MCVHMFDLQPEPGEESKTHVADMQMAAFHFYKPAILCRGHSSCRAAWLDRNPNLQCKTG